MSDRIHQDMRWEVFSINDIHDLCIREGKSGCVYFLSKLAVDLDVKDLIIKVTLIDAKLT
jgi:hypothetical protein